LVLSFNDGTPSRAFSLLGVSFSDIALKKVDSYRANTNFLWARPYNLKFDVTTIKNSFFTFQCTSNSEKVDRSNAKGTKIDNLYLSGNADLHNTFLEFYVFGGVYALAAYLLFMGSLIYFSISLIVVNMNLLRPSFLKFTFLASLLSVFAFNFTHPIFGLKFTWVFYGFIIGFFLKFKNKLI
jgi:hypothetical protein